MAIDGFVDWRGTPINQGVHGGVRAAWFIYFLTVVTNMVNVPLFLNLVAYLHGTMHMGVSGSATTVTNFIGATCGFALIGAFLSDSYITRARTILIFGPLEFMGFALLALQAYLPSLRPPHCSIETEPSNCKEVHVTPGPVGVPDMLQAGDHQAGIGGNVLARDGGSGPEEAVEPAQSGPQVSAI